MLITFHSSKHSFLSTNLSNKFGALSFEIVSVSQTCFRFFSFIYRFRAPNERSFSFEVS